MSTERLILETKLVKELNEIIKKLNSEIEVLEGKLKEKEGKAQLERINMLNKYIKLKVEEDKDGVVLYKVLQTKNIDIVEPGYTYEFYRPDTFKKNFKEGVWDNVDIEMVL
jgi:predicted Zn-dependent protease